MLVKRFPDVITEFAHNENELFEFGLLNGRLVHVDEVKNGLSGNSVWLDSVSDEDYQKQP